MHTHTTCLFYSQNLFLFFFLTKGKLWQLLDFFHDRLLGVCYCYRVWEAHIIGDFLSTL